jgi:translation initiation factor IF-2
MKMQPSVIVKKLFMEGVMVTVNQEIDFDKAEEIALGFDIIAEKEEKVDVIAELLKEDEEDEDDMVPRPPVVCVMGHVDHGKTSLLDAIRNTNVTRGEAGGITQHIGAYVVNIKGQKITFLDTPGHEAFTAMRMRGANATDIAVLVVAADDGVMPQTVEAISHAKAAGVEIIVAINKIDKPSANVERVKQELSEYELIPEDWGGSTIFVPVSAHTGEGIESLLEMILLTAEVSELKANPNREARGLVIEAQLDKGKGPVATILVQKGTLHVGDFIAAGACNGKVRAMMDDKGRRVKEAGPSTPVEILGLGDVPNAGEILMSFESDKEAKNFAGAFVTENKSRLLEETKGKLSLDNLFDQIQASDLKELPIIVKADVQGSVEAVKQSLTKLSNEEVIVKVIHGGVGAINESDVSLAATSNAIIIGFNVRPDTTAKQLAEQEGVDLRLYKVIYQAIEDVEAAMKGMLDPVFEEKVIGHAEVRQLFKASGVGTIAGSYVLDGTFQRNCKVRITRGEDQIFEGELASLKRFKDDVKEVRAGYECGLVFNDFNDVKEEDKVEAYIMVEVPR